MQDIVTEFFTQKYEKKVNKDILYYDFPREEVASYVDQVINEPVDRFVSYIKGLTAKSRIEPGDVIQFSNIEDATILEARICKKEVVGHITEYIDLSSNMRYSEEQKIGYDRIDPKSLRPLSEYYNSLGLRKQNSYSNQEDVHRMVKSLRKNGQI